MEFFTVTLSCQYDNFFKKTLSYSFYEKRECLFFSKNPNGKGKGSTLKETYDCGECINSQWER